MLTPDTALAARDAIRDRQVSATDLTRSALAQIERFDSTLKAFVSIHADRAIDQAHLVDDGKIVGRGRTPEPARRRADRDQGQPLHELRHDDLLVEDARKLPLAI